MSEAHFDPRAFLKFDLGDGRLSTPDDQRHFVVPASLIEAAFQGEDLAKAAREWGRDQGASIAELVGPPVLDQTPERLATELGYLLATLGWGRCDLESWGGVLFVLVRDPPVGGGARLLAEFLAGFFSSVAGGTLHFECIPMAEGAPRRFLLMGREGAERVRSWVEGKASAADVAGRMLAGAHIAPAAGGH